MKTMVAGSAVLGDERVVAEAIRTCDWKVDEVVTQGRQGVEKMAMAWASRSSISARLIGANDLLRIGEYVDAVIMIEDYATETDNELECLAAAARIPVYCRSFSSRDPIQCEPWSFTKKVLRVLQVEGFVPALQCWHDCGDEEDTDILYYEWTPDWAPCEGSAYTIGESVMDGSRYITVWDNDMNNFGGTALKSVSLRPACVNS